MQNRPWSTSYGLKVVGRAISGPALAIIGLILIVCQLTITDSEQATKVFKYLSWATLGAAGVMIFVSQYEVWKEEREEKETLEQKTNSKVLIRSLRRAFGQRAKEE